MSRIRVQIIVGKNVGNENKKGVKRKRNTQVKVEKPEKSIFATVTKDLYFFTYCTNSVCVCMCELHDAGFALLHQSVVRFKKWSYGHATVLNAPRRLR